MKIELLLVIYIVQHMYHREQHCRVVIILLLYGAAVTYTLTLIIVSEQSGQSLGRRHQEYVASHQEMMDPQIDM